MDSSDIKILSQLNSAHAFIRSIPSMGQLGDFFSALMSEIPGFKESALFIEGKCCYSFIPFPINCNGCKKTAQGSFPDEFPVVLSDDLSSFPITSTGITFGHFFFNKNGQKRADLYEPFVFNLLNSLAARLMSNKKDAKIECVLNELKATQQKTHEIVRRLPIPVCRIGENDEFLYLNNSFISTFGFTLEDLPDLKQWRIKAFPDPQTRKHVVQNWASSLKKAKENNSDILPVEALVTCKDGKQLDTLVSGILLDKEYLAIFINVTELKNAGRSLKLINEKLENSNKELERFAYTVSHDLKEPLRMVTSFCQLLKCKYSNVIEAEGNEYIEYAIDGAQRMNALLNDLLDLSRVGTSESKFEPFNSNDLVKTVLRDLGEVIDAKKAKVHFTNLPMVLGDKLQIGQVFQNLIENSIKFCSDRAPEIFIEANLKRDFCEFRVSDNGIGIAPENHERIFKIFQRLHGRNEYEGTGIGLAIVKKVIERHDGRIHIESEQGKGTSFFFTLPASLIENELPG